MSISIFDNQSVRAIRQALGAEQTKVVFSVPYSDYAVASRIRQAGRLMEEKHTDTGTVLTLSMQPRDRDRLISQIGSGYLAAAPGPQQDA